MVVKGMNFVGEFSNIDNFLKMMKINLKDYEELLDSKDHYTTKITNILSMMNDEYLLFYDEDLSKCYLFKKREKLESEYFCCLEEMKKSFINKCGEDLIEINICDNCKREIQIINGDPIE